MGKVTVIVPTALRQFAGGQEQVEVSGGTVGEVLGQFTSQYPDLKQHLYKDDGQQLRNFVNIYLNDEDIRYLQKEATAVTDGDTITIVPAIAGGANSGAFASYVHRRSPSASANARTRPSVAVQTASPSAKAAHATSPPGTSFDHFGLPVARSNAAIDPFAPLIWA